MTDCTCRKYGINPECPIHGRPGQLELKPETNKETSQETNEKYDPKTADIPF